MSLYEEIEAAAKSIRKRSGVTPAVGVVLGSGLGAFAEQIDDAVHIPYGDIPGFSTSTVAGHAGELVLGTLGGVTTAVMSGRVHYYEGHDMQRVTFPVRVLRALGVEKLIVTNAAGSVNRYYEPGDFMVIVDHLNLTGDNPLRGTNDERLGCRFPDMSEAYSEKARRAMHKASQGLGIVLREGVYAGLAGPSYETPAEIRMLQGMGADAVGMSTVAEVTVARHAGMQVAGLSVITNRAAGLGNKPLSHDEVKEVANKVRDALCSLLGRTVTAMAEA